MSQNEQWVREEIKGKFKELSETTEGMNTTYQDLWDTIQVVSRGKFISSNA